MKTKTVTTIEYHELDELVKKYFPECNYEFVADEEAHNDNVYAFDNITIYDFVNEIIPPSVDQYDRYLSVYVNKLREFTELISGNKKSLYNTLTFLQYFVYIGILPEGNYLIEVCY